MKNYKNSEPNGSKTRICAEFAIVFTTFHYISVGRDCKKSKEKYESMKIGTMIIARNTKTLNISFAR